MDVIRVHAPDDAHAQRLLSSLDGVVTAALNGHGSGPIVALTPDIETSAKLLELFNALGSWLADGDLGSCQISFGERDYTLLAPITGQSNDATTFLLERTIQLQTALNSRIVIEQAKGILAERQGVSPEDAFETLRREARSKRMKLHDLAASIVATTGETNG
jgi:hypothetical protein